MERTCKGCGETKPLESFGKVFNNRLGRSLYCLACGADRARKVYRASGERMDALKLASGCADCNYNAHAVALDFDHIPERGPKRGNLNDMRHRPWSEVAPEIAKCEVVCANCHRVRTLNRARAQR